MNERHITIRRIWQILPREQCGRRMVAIHYVGKYERNEYLFGLSSGPSISMAQYEQGFYYCLHVNKVNWVLQVNPKIFAVLVVSPPSHLCDSLPKQPSILISTGGPLI